MRATTSWALLLLLCAPVFPLLARERLRRLRPWRRRVIYGLRLSLFVALILALSDLRIHVSERRTTVVFVADTSASLGERAVRTEYTWIHRAIAASKEGDHAALVQVAAAPRLNAVAGPYKTVSPFATIANGETNLAAGIRLGLGLLTPGTPGRLVLLSDGVETTGDVAAAAILARSRGISIDTVPIAPSPPRDALLRQVDLPPTTRLGESTSLRIIVSTTYAVPAPALLQIRANGKTYARKAVLRRGDTVLRAEIPFTRLGLQQIRVTLRARGDTIGQNNRLDAVTWVGPAGRVLLVTDNPGASTPLALALAEARLQVVPRRPASLPATTDSYSGDDEVVLDNILATRLRAAQQSALHEAVRQGLGLFIVGGDHSFGHGSYRGSVLERTSPLASRLTPRQATGHIAVMLVIDKSGSMADTVSGVSKIAMVTAAAASTIGHLRDGDEIGILAFDDVLHVIVPFHPLHGAADRARVQGEIAGITANGNTAIYPALQAMKADLMQADTPFRHGVLLTDGQGESNVPFEALIRSIHRAGITFSTIGVGQDVAQGELGQWAAWGGGAFHYVSDPRTIPKLLIQEANFGAPGSPDVRGSSLRVEASAPSPLLQGIAGQALRPVQGYDVTVAKGGATVVLKGPRGAPLLAAWQDGLGRAVAWTADDGASWARAWSPLRLPTFWTAAISWALRGYSPPGPLPVLTVHGEMMTVSYPSEPPAGLIAHIGSPNGEIGTLPLLPAGDGTSSATFPVQQGVYTATLGTVGQAAALAIPYPLEYAEEGIDGSTLADLAEGTGGKILHRPAEAFRHAGLAESQSWLPLWPALLLAALLLFVADTALRLLVPTSGVYQARAL